MLAVPEAQALVLQHARPLPPESVPLDVGALGRVLAEDVASDLDMPPYDKAMMDGFAVRARDLDTGQATLTVVEEINAGQVPRQAVGAGQAARIMTGAPIPVGADAVVMVERTHGLDGNRVTVDDRPRMGQHILPRGREMRRDEVVLPAGSVLRPVEFGLLASVGRTSVRIYPAPRVAVLPTGDELADAPARPGPGQIRNSNGPMLCAQVCRAGGVPLSLGIARDRVDSLRPSIAEGLRCPVLILSGGVSAGKLDLVPGVLQELGVQPLFHKVAMRPGKPVFFGVHGGEGEGEGDIRSFRTLVFGLPGNPVSSLVCFELFVRPALRGLSGHADPGPRWVRARLAEDFVYESDRPTYHPARLEADDSWRVQPVPWFGSADLRGLMQANSLVLLPAGESPHRAGQSYPVLRLEEGP